LRATRYGTEGTCSHILVFGNSLKTKKEFILILRITAPFRVSRRMDRRSTAIRACEELRTARARHTGNNVEHKVVHNTSALFTTNRQNTSGEKKRADHAKMAGSMEEIAD